MNPRLNESIIFWKKASLWLYSIHKLVIYKSCTEMAKLMEYICKTTSLEQKNTCVTLGKFDGLHRGHQLLFERLIEYKEKGYRSVVFTFCYHPSQLFSNEEFPLIYTEEEKRELIGRFHPDVLISYPFTEETAAMEPEEFIQTVLIKQLDAKILIVGSDFRFGRLRRGDIAMLQKFEAVYGYHLIVEDKLIFDGEPVSSTRIRKELGQGCLKKANELLGNPYTIFGTVRHGRELGRTIGLPTVNLVPSSGKLLPPDGVYASCTWIQQRAWFGVTNIGFKPTVGAEAVRGVETYLFEFQEQIYDEPIEVQLFAYERPEKKFASIKELKDQMEKDIQFARTYFEKTREAIVTTRDKTPCICGRQSSTL